MKHLFYDDYSEGAHPEILQAVVASNDGQQSGYGNDEYCALAATRIADRVGNNPDVHFIAGGTAANQIALAAILRPHEGVIAPATAHINVHEAGAVEATGHKVIAVESPEGKLTPALIQQGLDHHEDEHSVLPRVMQLTQPTEMGTLYSLAELEAVVKFAKQNDLLVYVDGARLAMAVAQPDAGISLRDFSRIGVDMFYIGGTKVGGLYGEAMVILNDSLKQHFRYHIKQRGGLLAKQRSMGAQFARFFDDDELWIELGKASNTQAQRLSKGLESLGVTFTQPTATNQLFVALPNSVIESLQKDYGFYVWSKLDANTSEVRLVCSWATSDSAIDDFLGELAGLLK